MQCFKLPPFYPPYSTPKSISFHSFGDSYRLLFSNLMRHFVRSFISIIFSLKHSSMTPILTVPHQSGKKVSFILFLFMILQLSFSAVRASNEVVSAITDAGPVSPSVLGTQTPCTSIGFSLTSYTIPTGYTSLQSIQWWVNNGVSNTLVKTTTGAPNTSLYVTANTFIVYCCSL